MQGRERVSPVRGRSSHADLAGGQRQEQLISTVSASGGPPGLDPASELLVQALDGVHRPASFHCDRSRRVKSAPGRRLPPLSHPPCTSAAVRPEHLVGAEPMPAFVSAWVVFAVVRGGLVVQRLRRVGEQVRDCRPSAALDLRIQQPLSLLARLEAPSASTMTKRPAPSGRRRQGRQGAATTPPVLLAAHVPHSQKTSAVPAHADRREHRGSPSAFRWIRAFAAVPSRISPHDVFLGEAAGAATPCSQVLTLRGARLATSLLIAPSNTRPNSGRLTRRMSFQRGSARRSTPSPSSSAAG